MIPSWLANAAAFVILWFALAITLGPFLGAWLKRSAAQLPAACDDEREDRLATHQFEHDMAAGEDRNDSHR